MERFIRNDQYNLIKKLAANLVSGHATAKDNGVINALKSLTIEKLGEAFVNLDEERERLLHSIIEVEDKQAAEQYVNQLKTYVIPFREITESAIKKMFPKVKKMKTPTIDSLNLFEISFLGWNDSGSNRKYIIIEQDSHFIGIQGTFKRSSKKGICTICNRHEAVGMFTAQLKGATQDAYTKRGNYICDDSQKCNQNVTSLEKLHDFINLLNE